MPRIRACFCLFAVIAVAGLAPVAAKEAPSALTGSERQVQAWNAFADALYELHLQRREAFEMEVREVTSRYGGIHGERYVETSYFDKRSGQLLSRVRRLLTDPDKIHVIELFVYDDAGRLQRDYAAAYLTEFRNAPIQTFVNLHDYPEGLHAYRQFDASDRRIYEQCTGHYSERPVQLSLDEVRIPADAGEIEQLRVREAYRACFAGLPASAGPYLDPRVELNGERMLSAAAAGGSAGELRALTQAIRATPNEPDLYIKRGDMYFRLEEFDKAIIDYTRALRLDDRRDAAYFGRGMARGRAGDIDGGIADLTVYIERHPDSSRAYTKRGVRQIWAGRLVEAERDLKFAVTLDPSNAEAHDDLGVVYAQQKQYAKAIEHFRASVRHDPSFQKAFHNLAMTFYLLGQNDDALKTVEQALSLNPAHRDAMLLKGTILMSLGRAEEASAVTERARRLPAPDWSEQVELR